MAYLHIENLYRNQNVLAFNEVYALEKIHGTSAHIRYKDGAVGFFSGGEKHDRFVALFDVESLRAKFAELFVPEHSVVVFGEAYGGKQQGMSGTYGVKLRFVAFDVQVGDAWLAVPQAHELVSHLGLEFVDYAQVPATLTALDVERDRPSAQAVRNGIADPKVREGIVIRPPFEVTMNNGHRVIAKHKRAEFSERASKADTDPAKAQANADADAVALEWVTPMRLEHVINRLVSARDEKDVWMSDTGQIIRLMIEDVLREGSGEIVASDAVTKAIGRRAAALFKMRFDQKMRESVSA